MLNKRINQNKRNYINSISSNGGNPNYISDSECKFSTK